MAEPFLGETRIFSFTFAPKGWALCNGQLLPINQNQALFSLLGTTYGGDGRVNFALPDLRGRVPIHEGRGHVLGERAGEQAHTLSIAELPSHQHLLRVSADTARLPAPTNATLAGAPFNAYSGPAVSGSESLTFMHTDTISTVGGSQAHLNMQPFLVLNVCIALQGIFPSQN